MGTKQFQKTVENFTCENCGHFVEGNGYTNHCPECLFSKHVDINPGDRAAECGGLMEPIGVEIKTDDYTLIHRCLKCGHTKKNRTSPDDDFEELLRVASRTNGT